MKGFALTGMVISALMSFSALAEDVSTSTFSKLVNVDKTNFVLDQDSAQISCTGNHAWSSCVTTIPVTVTIDGDNKDLSAVYFWSDKRLLMGRRNQDEIKAIAFNKLGKQLAAIKSKCSGENFKLVSVEGYAKFKAVDIQAAAVCKMKVAEGNISSFTQKGSVWVSNAAVTAVAGAAVAGTLASQAADSAKARVEAAKESMIEKKQALIEASRKRASDMLLNMGNKLKDKDATDTDDDDKE